MTSLMVQTAVWTGFAGAPGYSTFRHRITGTEANAAQAGHDDVWNFFTALNTLLPSDVDVTVDPVVTIHDSDTGENTGEVVVGTPTGVVSGNNLGNWSGQVGAAIEWETGTYINGRRLRGRTYLVPLGGFSDDDGTVSGGAVTTIMTAAANIVNSPQDFIVWHRPVGGLGGQSWTIASALVRDHAYILRSRAR